jgi:hypothetical protein
LCVNDRDGTFGGGEGEAVAALIVSKPDDSLARDGAEGLWCGGPAQEDGECVAAVGGGELVEGWMVDEGEGAGVEACEAGRLIGIGGTAGELAVGPGGEEAGGVGGEGEVLGGGGGWAEGAFPAVVWGGPEAEDGGAIDGEDLLAAGEDGVVRRGALVTGEPFEFFPGVGAPDSYA